MRRICVAVVGLIAGFLIPLGIASPAEAAVKCGMRHRTDTAHVNDGSAGNDEWWLKVTFHYRYCNPDKGLSWVVPQGATLRYNAEGKSMGCNPWTQFNVFRNLYGDPSYNDLYGMSMNPPRMAVPCDEDSVEARTVWYRTNRVRLYFYKGVAPQATMTWHLSKENAGTNLYERRGTFKALLRKCSGYATNRC